VALPTLFSVLGVWGIERGTADIIVIGLLVADRVVRQFEMRDRPAVGEDRGAAAGAERHDHLDADPPDRAETLHIGVVHDPHRLAPAPAQLGLQIVSGPRFGPEMRRRQDAPVPHHAGKADRGALELSQRRGRLVDHVGHQLRGGRHRRGRYARRLADHLARAVEQGELDPAAADIDGKGAAFLRSLHGASPRAGAE